MEPLFEVRVEPTYQDYLQFNLHASRARTQAAVTCGFILGLSLVVALLLTGFRKGSLTVVAVMVPLAVLVTAAIFVGTQVAFRSRVWRHWNASPSLREPRSYRFTEEGFDVESESSRGFTSWKLIRSGESARGLILLVGEQRLCHIPESAFASPEEVTVFKDFLRSVVPNCQRLR